VLASTPPNLIPQSLTGASRGAIEGVYIPNILSLRLTTFGVSSARSRGHCVV
jgi:hypothetical protein